MANQHKLQGSEMLFDLKDFPLLPIDKIKLSECPPGPGVQHKVMGGGFPVAAAAAQLKAESARPGAAPKLWDKSSELCSLLQGSGPPTECIGKAAGREELFVYKFE